METRVFVINSIQDQQEEIRAAAEIIRTGGLLALPTETVYGLGANGLDGEAVRKIFLAKGRPQDNPLILHIPDASWLSRCCDDVPPAAYRLAEAFWPGPLTMILKRKAIVPDETTAGLDTVGMRCPDHAVTLAILREAGLPIAAPSANRSGRPSCTAASHVLEDMAGRIEGLVDGGECRVGVESSIIDLTVAPPRLLRPGGLPLEKLQEILGEVEVDKAVLQRLSEGEKPKAPGMKYRHYAPKAPVTVFTGDAGKTARAIARRAKAGSGVICFEEYRNLYPDAVVHVLGKAEDTEEQARRVFDALRSFDAAEVSEIYAQCPAERGLGLAVANRLKKAAGFRIVALPEGGKTVFGFTGPTGSGKTCAMHAVEELGGFAIDCDALYHDMLQSDTELKNALCSAFGADIFKEGQLDRKALAAIVFRSEDELKRLNDIVFDLIPQEVLRRIEASDAALIGIDAVNLTDCVLLDFCDHTVAVTAPAEIRLARIMKRDALTREEAEMRLGAQPPDEYYVNRCDEHFVSDAPTKEETTARMRRRIEDILKSEEMSHE